MIVTFSLFPLTKGIVAFSSHLLADDGSFNVEGKRINKTGVNTEYSMLNVSDLMKTTFFEEVLFHGKER